MIPPGSALHTAVKSQKMTGINNTILDVFIRLLRLHDSSNTWQRPKHDTFVKFPLSVHHTNRLSNWPVRFGFMLHVSWPLNDKINLIVGPLIAFFVIASAPCCLNVTHFCVPSSPLAGFGCRALRKQLALTEWCVEETY